jgi:hypothetical protein
MYPLVYVQLTALWFYQLSTAAPNLSLKGTPYWMAPEVIIYISFIYVLPPIHITCR